MNIIITIVFLLGIVGLGILKKKQVSLSVRTLFALALGVLFGGGLQLFFGFDSSVLESVIPLFTFFARTYTTLLRLLVAPVLFVGIVLVVLKLSNNSHSKEITQTTGLSAFLLFINTGIASVMGVIIVLFLRNGVTIDISTLSDVDYKYEYNGIFDSLLGYVPKNIFTTLSSGSALSVVILALIVGSATSIVQKKNASIVAPFVHLFESLHEIVKELVNIIVRITPYGVFALITRALILNEWVSLFTSLGNFVLANVIGFVVLFVWQVGYVSVIAKKSPIAYIRSVSEALLVAFSTRSSFATVPVTNRVLKEEFHLHEDVSNTVPSLAASIGMNACGGLWPAIVATTTLVALDRPITILTVLFIAGVNIVASIGISGVPGTATVAASASFSMLGIPFTLVPLVQSVDFFIDMVRTALNVNGGVAAAVTSDAIVYGNGTPQKNEVNLSKELA